MIKTQLEPPTTTKRYLDLVYARYEEIIEFRRQRQRVNIGSPSPRIHVNKPVAKDYKDMSIGVIRALTKDETRSTRHLTAQKVFYRLSVA